MTDFLFEIGLEEIPARMIAGAEAELGSRIVRMLERERLAQFHGSNVWKAGTLFVEGRSVAKTYATPRRLAVFVEGVLEKQEDLADGVTGPSVSVAYKDGIPTPAAHAFAKKVGQSVEQLMTVENAKGKYLYAHVMRTGRTAAEVIAAELPKELAGIYWAKNMYWRAGRPERFVRPVRWLVALLGETTVPVSFGGYEGGAMTFGHRVLFGDDGISLKSAGEYEAALLKGFVVADVEVRRQRIRKALDAATRAAGAGVRWREDEELVETVTQLTEWPSVVMGEFEKEYLALPEEVLVTVMRDHQKYFAVEEGAGNRDQGAGNRARLAAHFLAVLNTEADEAGLGVIRHGNERVLRARFNDARFFWEFDQRVPLVERVELLKHVTFQKDLGSYAAKTERVRALAARLAGLVAGRGVGLDARALDDAARLAKTDLTSELVKEFTELQGVVGGLYARAQGFSAAVSDAIYDQYRPVSMEDSVPRTVEGSVLALADKADTIAGLFGLGLEPTGSKDPFALRRAANGIVKILAESSVALPLPLGEVAATAADGDQKLAEKVHGFLVERLEFYLREARGQAYDVVKAVMAVGTDDVRDAVARAEAVTVVRGSDDFAAVSAAFKRMKNILAQAKEKGILDIKAEPPSHAIIKNPAQDALTEAAGKISERFSMLAENREYIAALEAIATLRPQVDVFFKEVMVMDDDPYIRNSRLSLLDSLVQTFSSLADFSEIVTVG